MRTAIGSGPVGGSRAAPALACSPLLGVVLACALLIGAAPARADVFGPASLVSQGSFAGHETQQAEYAHDTAISGNGEYVAFDGSIGGVSGVWRRDLASGAIEQVAGGDAELPSISDDGRYVSFTTNEGANLPTITDGLPDEHPKPEAVNVYVRDMDVPAGEPCQPGASPLRECAFTVASAPNGSSEPLRYGNAGTTLGSAATGRSAISANGEEVAFVTTAVSDLVRYPQQEREETEHGETPKPHTPALQVAVRYPDEHRTLLVSRCYLRCEPSGAAEPVVSASAAGEDYGAVYPGEKPDFAAPPAYGALSASPPPGASLSADGSTVAWIGEDIGQQAPLLAAESRAPSYIEPLWRRIAPGSETQTERVTGGSDPENPACIASGETALPPDPSPADPCQGPFAVEEETPISGILNVAGGETGDFVPRLSADGYTVAFVSQAPLVTAGENFGRPKAGQESDLYIADMHPGLTRDQALTPLTELAGGEGAGPADTAAIYDFDISPDGRQVAFATRRTQFLLGSPAFISPPAAEPGMNELFDVDLGNDTLTRVTHGYGAPNEAGEHAHAPVLPGEDPYKEAPGDGTLSPSFSDDGRLLAFASTAANLVFGDGNAPPLSDRISGSVDGSDAFVVERETFVALPTPQYVSPVTLADVTPAWRLGVTAVSRRNGTVALYVDAPASGELRAAAQGATLVRSAVRAARRSRHASRAQALRPAREEAVRTSTVASASQPATAVGPVAPVTLTLRLAAPHAALASRPGGFSADATVTFVAPGKPTLRTSVAVTFLRSAHPKHRVRRSRAAALPSMNDRGQR